VKSNAQNKVHACAEYHILCTFMYFYVPTTERLVTWSYWYLSLIWDLSLRHTMLVFLLDYLRFSKLLTLHLAEGNISSNLLKLKRKQSSKKNKYWVHLEAQPLTERSVNSCIWLAYNFRSNRICQSDTRVH